MLFASIVCALIFTLCSADFDDKLLFCKTAPPKLTDGLIKRDRVSYYKEQGYLGVMEYSCLPGFHLMGNKTITCQSGTWSAIPQCISEKRCSPIRTYPPNTMVETSNITLFQKDPQQIVIGSTVTLRCINNYEYDLRSNASLVVECQNDGTWTSMPSCRYTQALCDYSKLYLPHRSRITRMNFKFSSENRQLHTVGSNLEYACEEGYRLSDGKSSLIVECLNTGQWSPLPVCQFVEAVEQSIRCSYPVYIKNGFLTLYNVTIWEDQTYTGRIVYECNYGFETNDGNDQVISDCVNGQWTNVNDCREIPTCSKQDLLDIESKVEHSYVHNVSLQYVRDPWQFVCDSYVLRVCLPNFQHDPTSPPLKIQCQRHTRTWTGIPVCRAMKASTNILTAPATTVNTFASRETSNKVVNTFYTTTVTTTITSVTTTTMTTTITTTPITTIEYEENSPTNDSTYTIVCYSNEIPYIPNSMIIPSEFNISYNVGTRLSITCQTGNESTFRQSYFIECSLNGTWIFDSIDMVQCETSSEMTVQNNFFSTSTISLSTTIEPSSTTMDFDEDLPIMNVSSEALMASTQALSTGNRNIRHTASYCRQLPIIEHTLLLSDDTIKHLINDEIMYTGSILYICRYGFTSVPVSNEPFRVTCNNGIFHTNTACAEKPRCSLPPPINSVRSSIVDSSINVFDTSTNEAIPGSFVVLNCFDKNTNENTIFNMTCLDDGQWSSPPLMCLAPFKRRCQSGITIPNARTQIFAKLTTDGYYDDGSRATYRCLENYIHDPRSGPLHIQCRNGRWGPRPRCIPTGCLEPMPDKIENGWKSAESYITDNNNKYYLLARYSCHDNAVFVDSTARVLDIQCRNNEWQYKEFPKCEQNQ